MAQKILVIEDENVQRQVLTDKLKSAGFNTIEASDGETGLQTALSEQPDLILLDNKMPNMSGYQMLRKMRMSGRWGAMVPVIFFSNVDPATKEEQEALEEVQPTAYLLKSDTDLNTIVARIKETLGVAN